MARRLVELGLVLAAASLLVFFTLGGEPDKSSDHNPQPTSSRATHDPDGPPLALNGVRPGDDLDAVEQWFGPPNFSNPRANFQQWEEPLTQVHYVVKEDGRRFVETVEGGGALTQGVRVLLSWGETAAAAEEVFGLPLERAQEGRQLIFKDLRVWCGSPDWDGHRRISVLSLGVDQSKKEGIYSR